MGWLQEGVFLSLLLPRALLTLLGTQWLSWESLVDLHKLRVSLGLGGSVSRRQPAKTCHESAWPINI